MRKSGLAEPDLKPRCVAVLPAQTAAADQPLTPAQERMLRQETVVLNRVLRDSFSGREDIKMLSQEPSGSGGQAWRRIKTAADQSGCTAVLETTAHRYKERVGGSYAAEEPAAAAFSWRLTAVPEGAVLCQGRFDGEQKPLSANLFNFRRSVENSFTWVTAERLLSQNLREQLADCPSLQP
jgi:hypothetical protein